MRVLVSWSATDDQEFDATGYHVNDDGTVNILAGSRRVATVSGWRTVELVDEERG